ncbi:MAG: small multi-drug export protein, partial [Clostridia bacterium]|nr:small multi-drug export protein [Clostridia bacterium]
MAESLASNLVEFFGTDGGTFVNYLIVFFISMLPILELRGGLVAAFLLHLPLIPAMIVCYIGNMLPIPFLLMFVKKVLHWLGKFKLFKPFINWLENRGQQKAKEMKEKEEKWEEWGLMAFVAIPLPGTGGWTGSLVAAFLNLDN